MKRLILPIVFGLVGCAILVSLGVWQVQRLAWKQGILSEINARIAASPVELPEQPTPEADQYLAVSATGRIAPDTLRVLVSQKEIGAGYRIISPFDLGARTVMLDRGITPVDQDAPLPPDGAVRVTGNLLWPDEIDSFTPEPDLARNIWFGRDLSAMASALGAAPILIVLRERSFDDTPISPVPIGTEGIPNDHLGYAITWFSLAIVWAGMTGFFLWRMTNRRAGG